MLRLIDEQKAAEESGEKKKHKNQYNHSRPQQSDALESMRAGTQRITKDVRTITKEKGHFLPISIHCVLCSDRIITPFRISVPHPPTAL